MTGVEIPELVGAEHAAWHVVLDLADAPPLIGPGSVGVPRCARVGRKRDAAETLAAWFGTEY